MNARKYNVHLFKSPPSPQTSLSTSALKYSTPRVEEQPVNTECKCSNHPPSLPYHPAVDYIQPPRPGDVDKPPGPGHSSIPSSSTSFLPLGSRRIAQPCAIKPVPHSPLNTSSTFLTHVSLASLYDREGRCPDFILRTCLSRASLLRNGRKARKISLRNRKYRPTNVDGGVPTLFAEPIVCAEAELGMESALPAPPTLLTLFLFSVL